MDLDFHIRYFIEHKALPSNLYSEGARLLSRFMISGKNAVLDYYKKADTTAFSRLMILTSTSGLTSGTMIPVWFCV